MDKELTFSIIDENDVTYTFEILATYRLFKTKKHYMIYTDNTYDSNGVLNAYAAIYDPNDKTVFEELQTDEEWEVANNRIEELRYIR